MMRDGTFFLNHLFSRLQSFPKVGKVLSHIEVLRLMFHKGTLGIYGFGMIEQYKVTCWRTHLPVTL